MKIDNKYLLLTLSLYTISFFASSARLLLIIFVAYFILLLYQSKKISIALLLTYLASLPFQVGKTINFVLLSRSDLNLPYRLSGIESMFVISVKEIILAAMAVLLLHQIVTKKHKIKVDPVVILLLLYFFFVLMATLFGAKQKEISLLFCLYEIRPLIFYLFWQMFVSAKTKLDVMPKIFGVFAAMILLQFSLTMFQLFQEKPLGLTIEPTRDTIPIDSDVELGSFQIRPTGTFSHSSGLISFILPYVSLFYPTLFTFFSPSGGTLPYLFVLTLLISVTTLSRGAWLISFTVILISLWLYEKRWRLKLQFNSVAKRAFVWLSIVAIALLPIFIIPRILNSFTYLTTSGGLATRLRQISETLKVVVSNPLWGIGLETDTAYIYQNSTTKSMIRIFPEPVHNYYLRLLVQVGIFPFLTLLGILFFLFKRITAYYYHAKSLRQKAFIYACLLSVFSICLYANFQPILSLTDVILFSVISFPPNENQLIS